MSHSLPMPLHAWLSMGVCQHPWFLHHCPVNFINYVNFVNFDIVVLIIDYNLTVVDS